MSNSEENSEEVSERRITLYQQGELTVPENQRVTRSRSRARNQITLEVARSTLATAARHAIRRAVHQDLRQLKKWPFPKRPHDSEREAEDVTRPDLTRFTG